MYVYMCVCVCVCIYMYVYMCVCVYVSSAVLCTLRLCCSGRHLAPSCIERPSVMCAAAINVQPPASRHVIICPNVCRRQWQPSSESSHCGLGMLKSQRPFPDCISECRCLIHVTNPRASGDCAISPAGIPQTFLLVYTGACDMDHDVIVTSTCYGRTCYEQIRTSDIVYLCAFLAANRSLFADIFIFIFIFIFTYSYSYTCSHSAAVNIDYWLHRLPTMPFEFNHLSSFHLPPTKY
jgi:hypothetical protein